MSGFITEPSTTPPSGPAGGDLSGTYPNPTVVGLQTNPVAAGAPGLNNVLKWNGVAWAPAALAAPTTYNLAPYFKWDGSTTTQFAGSPAFQTVGWTNTLTVAASANAPGGSVLRFASSAGTGSGACVWLVTAPLPTGVYRYIARLVTFTATLGGGGYVGTAFYADSTLGSYYGYARFVGVAGWGHRIDAGTLSVSGATSAGALGSNLTGRFEMEVSGEKTAATEPRFSTPYTLSTGTGSAFGSGDLTQLDYANRPVPAGWQTTTNLRFGLALQASGGNAAPSMDISEFSILPHPLDYGNSAP